MTERTLNAIFAKPEEFYGGQVEYCHLGDTYRGEIFELERQGECVLIKLKWVAIWCAGSWWKHDGDVYAIEAVAGAPLVPQEDGGQLCTSFIFRDTLLYPKGHPSNIAQISLAYYPMPSPPQAAN